MKKVLFAAVAVLTFGFANAQEGKFKVGANVGLPMGDIKDSYSFTIGLDAAYTWAISDKFDAGVGAGYGLYMGKEDFIEDASFVPVYGTAQYLITDSIFLGADLGYAVGIAPSENDGGFYYQPKVGFQVSEFSVYAGYKGISVEGGTFSSLNLGFNYRF
ncbi:hypothetical protein [Flavobacterium psychraquaticum]|uniref:hypothetical protein n=1 Tax=Flavobacterium psychraquaticum TaxID=3103958 RepID=UPI002ACD363D|nr:hypothetical protein [Flavobacterium sp. LB-N7T]